MSEDVRKVVIRWFVEEVLNTGKLAAVDELFAPDYVAHAPLRSGPRRGVAAWKQRVVGYLAAFPDLHFAIEDLIAERDVVVARLTWSGTQRGVFLGLAATNERVAVTAIGIWRIADGRIVEEWIAEDLLSLLQRLGGIPVSAQRQEVATNGELPDLDRETSTRAATAERRPAEGLLEAVDDRL